MTRYFKARMSVKNIQKFRRSHSFKSPAQNLNVVSKARDSFKILTLFQHVINENNKLLHVQYIILVKKKKVKPHG